MDRDWHVSTPYCQICDKVLPAPKSTTETGGASSSHDTIPCGYCGVMMHDGQEVATCAECNCRHHGNITTLEPCSDYCRHCLLRWCCNPQCQRANLWHDCTQEVGNSSEDESPTRARTNESCDDEGMSKSDADGSDTEELACPAVTVEEVCWDDWEERVEDHRRTQQPSRAARAASSRSECHPSRPATRP